MSVININIALNFRVFQWLKELADNSDKYGQYYKGKYFRLALVLLTQTIGKEWEEWQKKKQQKQTEQTTEKD